MLRISRLTDYGIVILCQMLENSSPLSAAELSRRSGLPRPTVSKLLKLLAKDGLIHAKRGALGGYSLHDDLRKTSLLKIVELLDGPIGLTDCLLLESPCRIENLCAQKRGWKLLNERLKALLASIYLSDFINQKPTMMEQKLSYGQ